MSVIRLQGENERRDGVYYEVDTESAPIGAGGMGQVFRGICVNQINGATRPVAIKFMYDDLPDHAVERARREASICLRNDNLVEMLGFIETVERGVGGEVKKHYHVVSELLTGVSLSDVMEGKVRDVNGEDVPFAIKMAQDFKNDPEHFATIIVTNVLSGLMALHDAGYIHRDIDPSNIMLTTEGRIKLIDYGIAKQMNNLTTSDKSLTVAGSFMGKPEYASPELVLGDVKHQNQTTDIYAVGILLYQCIIGHPPFEGPRHEVLDKQLKTKLPLAKIKNSGLRKIIATACEKKQEQRYQSSAQMRVALENLGGSKPAMSKNKKIGIIAACVAIVVALGSVTFVVKHKQDVANEQAEMARIEQQQQEIKADFESRVDNANLLLKSGMDKENENYEQFLMKAYDAFSNAEDVVKKNSLGAAQLKAVSDKKSAVVAALDSAINELSSQAAALEELGETELASNYKNRVTKINEFKNKIK